MAGENDDNRKGDEGAQPAPSIGAEHPPNPKWIGEGQGSISEQAFVDRVRKSDRWMIGLTGVLAVTGIISAFIFGWQLLAMRGQLDEMRDEQRPWIQVRPKLNGPLTNSKGSLEIGTGLEIKNVGHRPAVGVTAKAEIVESAIWKYGSIFDALKQVCDSAQDDRWTFFKIDAGEDIVFPDEEDVIDTLATSSLGKPSLADIKLVPLDWKTIPKLSGATPVKMSEGVILIYCVYYKTLGDSMPHHTGGTIAINVLSGSDEIKDGQSISLNELKLERPAFEWRNLAD